MLQSLQTTSIAKTPMSFTSKPIPKQNGTGSILFASSTQPTIPAGLYKVYFLGKKISASQKVESTFVVNADKSMLIDKTKLDDALRTMGRKYLKEPYKSMWTPENPVLGYCYVVSEVLYHYLAPKGSVPQVITFDNKTTHWYIKTPEGKLLDQTSEQFDFKVPYEKGKGCGFLTHDPSKRAKILAVLVGIEKLEDQKPALQKEITKLLNK